MKTGINYIFGAAVLFALAACGKSQVPYDLENQNSLLGFNVPKITPTGVIPYSDIAKLEAEKTANMETNLQKILDASSLVRAFGITGLTRSEVCIMIATSKDAPDLMKKEYAQSLAIQLNLNGITKEEEEKKVSEFNNFADLWMTNITFVIQNCSTPNVPEDNAPPDKPFELHAPQYQRT